MTANLPSGKIEFIQFHKPPLTDGFYEVGLSQEIETLQSHKIRSQDRMALP